MSQVKEFGTSLYVGRRNHSSAYWNQSSTYWGQCPVFSHPAFPQGSPQRVDAVWWLLDGRYSFLPEFPPGSPAHHPCRLQLLVTMTSIVYWYRRKYSISQGRVSPCLASVGTVHMKGCKLLPLFIYKWLWKHCGYWFEDYKCILASGQICKSG